MSGIERRGALIHGVVQGVGMRPYVHRLATRLALAGFVRNEAGAVRIELEGTAEALAQFARALDEQPPPRAQIEQVAWQQLPPTGARRFFIEASTAAAGEDIFLAPDMATCDECLAELFDPADRRYRYPFVNCTQCGPRLTIIRGAPYDRARTTMAEFPLCRMCHREFEDPSDRRYHAQPIACPECGPRLALLDAAGQTLASADPLAEFAKRLRGGKIGALKGLGGYHLVCDATSEAAVRELRRRKGRDEKPLALMVADLAAAKAIGDVSEAEGKLLASPRRPIVLLRRRRGPIAAWAPIAASVAPGNPFLGVMLPYSPVHHLLVREAGGLPLVMTSGNRSDEPIARDDADAVERLGGIADVFLSHNRPIHVRCDDSVTRVISGRESPIRRSRGDAPLPIDLPLACPAPILAVGGQFKGTFALGRDRVAFLSHHLGDLDHWPAYEAFTRDVRLYEDLFQAAVACIAHDLHPDYASTRYARERGVTEGLPLVAVQHHHAHIASCLAEHGRTGPVIGVAFDGTGLGTDGAIWGGEFLVADLHGFQRAAHLRYVGLPGGDQAIREPWRSAAAHLVDAGCDVHRLAPLADPPRLRTTLQMLGREGVCPKTSSAGRLFDAVAAILGLRGRVSYEGQAAMELEWLATEAGDENDRAYPFALSPPVQGGAPGATIVDTRPLIRAIVDDLGRGAARSLVARRFHHTMCAVIVDVCQEIRVQTGLTTVALSGGVLMNALLAAEAEARLAACGFEVLCHRRVPPNDGGLALGQLAVAAATIGRSGSPP